MLLSFKSMLGYTVCGIDGAVGKVTDFYFNDDLWIIQSMVVDTGDWLSGRTLLVDCSVVEKMDWDSGVIQATITRIQASNYDASPFTTVFDEKSPYCLHMQSVRQVIGCRVQALDGDIGHVSDCFVDSKDWTIRYIDVDTSDWLPMKNVLVPPCEIERMEWQSSKVFLLISHIASVHNYS